MKIFSEKHQELNDFEEVILDIEKDVYPLEYEVDFKLKKFKT